MTFNHTDWDNLLSEINSGNCALFLGHDLLLDPNGNSVYKNICDRLATDLKGHIHTYYPEENFFLFNELKNRRKFSNQIEKYYKSLQPDQEIYRMLAEIPVSLYISVSPDNFLQKALDQHVTVSFFNDPQKRGVEVDATREKPLLYNIFGSIHDNSSLLLSHDDLFDFFRDIFSGHGLPTAVKKFFREDAGGEVIFLGFSFNKWYVQLLLRLFNLTKNNELSRTAYLNHTPLEDEITYASQHFKVEFIETHIREFIVELHKRCKENNMLRDLKKVQSTAEVIYNHTREEQINQSGKLLQEYNQLRQAYEYKRLYENDPKRLMEYEQQIDNLDKLISKESQKLITLSE